MPADARPTLPPLRDVIAAHGLQASKALGQNFLLDEQLLDRIAAIPGSIQDQPAFEVGPGPGGLTRAILRAGGKLVAVERDRRCLPALAELELAFPGQLRVISGDAMEVDARAEAGDGAHIIANLPYNVGTALLVGWLSALWAPLPWWSSLTLMFQMEVAERIVAKPGTDHYGRLAVLAQWRSDARIAMEGASQRLHPAAKGDVGRGPHHPQAGARRRAAQDPGTPDRRRFRPAPQDAAPEPQVRPRRPRCTGSDRHRPATPRRNRQRRRIRHPRPPARPGNHQRLIQ